jgi:hypothetical protein
MELSWSWTLGRATSTPPHFPTSIQGSSGVTDASSTARRVEFAATGTIAMLWGFAFWQSWICQGLYADGANWLLKMLLQPGFTDGPLHPRAYAIMLFQAPAVLALKLGVTDIHWLARLLSFGMYALPTVLFSMALLRARRNEAVLAVTIAAASILFMSTSFHISCETNPAYAAAILIAVWLVTASHLTVGDAATLVLIAGLSTRLYEQYVYLGPLLALMVLWAIARAPARPALATALHGVAAALLFISMIVAMLSLLAFNADGEEHRYLAGVVGSVWDFRFNIQFDLLLVAAALFVLWALLRPADLVRPWPYLVAGLPVLLVMLSPLLVWAERFVAPPYSWTQPASRTIAGPIAAAIVLILWLSRRRRATSPPIATLREPRAAGRLLLLACAMFAAMVPWRL